nr:hypothetical protein [Tanacetum cinerariifolium]
PKGTPIPTDELKAMPVPTGKPKGTSVPTVTSPQRPKGTPIPTDELKAMPVPTGKPKGTSVPTELASPEQTATGKAISNPFMAVMICQKSLGYSNSPLIQVLRVGLVINSPGLQIFRVYYSRFNPQVPTGRVIVPTGSYIVPTSKVKVATGRAFASTLHMEGNRSEEVKDLGGIHVLPERKGFWSLL